MGKKNSGFNIIREDSTTHGGYHTGTLNISNLSAILVDGDEAHIDLGLIHAKSKAERGIKFSSDPKDVPKEGNPKDYWVVWVAIDRKEEGPYYAGLTACSMTVNREARRGWKNLAEHVNRMDDALKRRIKVAGLDDQHKGALKRLLIENNSEWWENASQELKSALTTADEK
ncbi:YwhD family protein [Marininema mesophilum]|uniref:YwhD family protein n=1 Tax=Marininema mesophilum TaxID=1048340 RepID=A0A1H3ALT0_9BACL|nr:YwhD family protein [Marininema mesophilum]SDX29779.1 YwhD family protein [Marininema mesophilum]